MRPASPCALSTCVPSTTASRSCSARILATSCSAIVPASTARPPSVEASTPSLDPARRRPAVTTSPSALAWSRAAAAAAVCSAPKSLVAVAVSPNIPLTRSAAPNNSPRPMTTAPIGPERPTPSASLAMSRTSLSPPMLRMTLPAPSSMRPHAESSPPDPVAACAVRPIAADARSPVDATRSCPSATAARARVPASPPSTEIENR